METSWKQQMTTCDRDTYGTIPYVCWKILL